MQHEVQCICSVPKPLNTEFETTVTFVNRDGKPGNYVNVTWYPKPLHCGCTTFVQLPDNNFKTRLYDVALHTLPILILIIVHQLPNPFKKLY
jgi:hypothetical protein